MARYSIVISQRIYILHLLKEAGNIGYRLAETPMDPNLLIDQNEETISIDKGMYQRLMGKLSYLSYTRSNIVYSVSIVSQYMNNPSERHLGAVNKILRYLQGTPCHGMLIKKSSNRLVELYTNWRLGHVKSE